MPVSDDNLPWAAPPITKTARASLHDAESRFPVSLLATARRNLKCCQPDEEAALARNRPQPGDFDFLPVEQDGQIIGLFDRKDCKAVGKVKDVMRPLCEDLLMASDASMLHFLEQADSRRFVFLVEGKGILGAVTLSDIQKIEARPAIFLRVTLFEVLINEWLRLNANDDWLTHVFSDECNQIERWFEKHKSNGEEVDRIAVASATPKLRACNALGLFHGLDGAWETVNEFVWLRDKISHAQNYADSPARAEKIPEVIRKLRRFIEHLEAVLDLNN